MTHFNITPDNHDEVVARLATMVLDAPPDVFDNGRYWYDEAHDYARKFARDEGHITLRQGAGIIAACSPNLEADTNFQQIGEIMQGSDQLHVTGRQRDKAFAMFYTDPTEVLSPVTGPKTWAFFWNIYAPSLRDHVTVDGRHADVIANCMRGWKTKRGIDTGNRRYQSYEWITEDAAQWLRRNTPHRWMTAVQVQAIVWCQAKAIELAGITTRGNPRKNGPARKGQRYI